MEHIEAKKEALKRVLEFARELKKEKIASKMKPKAEEQVKQEDESPQSEE